MLGFEGEALVLTLLPHGESGAVVRFLTFEGGMRAGYVPGARGKGRRAILYPGNRVSLRLRARAEGQLPSATLELVTSRALLAFDPISAAIVAWTTELISRTLAEAAPNQRIALAMDALFAGLDAGLPSDQAKANLARFELLLLEEEGFGLDLESCALGGNSNNLAYVSPRTGRAVSAEMANGQSWQKNLLRLPRFLLTGEPATADDADDALKLTGHFLEKHWLHTDSLRAMRARATSRASQSLAASS